MSVGGDKDRHPQITPQHTQTQWENHPPANIGYQWTCHLCQSTFGTIEQREKHQHECPGRIPHVQALQLGRTYPPMHVTGETFRPDRYQQTSQIPDFSQVVRARPPNPGYQHTPVPATYQHISGRRTQLLWLKETPTMDLQVTYIDDAEGGVVLKWDPISQLFEGGADLSIGQHSGCLTLNTSDVVLPITPFLVEHGGPSVQKIIISSGRKRMSNPHMGQPAEMERERTNRGSIRTLEETVNRLTTDLDNRNNELVQQRQVNDRYKQQNINLSQQMEVLSVEIQQLKASDNPVTVVPLEIEKLTRQIQESEKKNEMLEREAHKLKEEKISANDYSDYLYQQKQFFESQLQKAEERFKESQSQIDELTRKLDILTEKESAPPPLPTRSKPVSKEKDTKPANEELANLQ